MKWLQKLFSTIIDGFQNLINFFAKGFVEILRQLGEFIYSFLAMAFWDILTLLVTALEWLFNTIFQGVDLKEPIESAWFSLNADVVNALLFFRVPGILTVLFTALLLRLLIRLVPFL